MKLNKIRIYNFLILLLISFFQHINAQIVFKEDFGNSNVRKPSQNVPQSGKDANLANTFTHGSKFYKFAAIQPNYNGENENQNVINNGYYAVVAPANVYSGLPSGLPTWANWWPNIKDHTGQSINGAVLVVNGGLVLNQYYRKALTLEKGKTYEASVMLYGAGNSNVGVKFEAQEIGSELVLGSSTNLNLSAANTWQKKTWRFTIPDNNNCVHIALSLRNTISDNSGNDFYADDIILEEVTGAQGDLISCSNSPSLDSFIKANDDSYTVTSVNGIYNILSNDTLGGGGNFILSGAGTNASILPIGVWPQGYSINASGQLFIDALAPPLTHPLEYQISNLLGVTSNATITINRNPSVPIHGNPDTFAWNGSGSYNILANDIYNNGAPGTGFIFSGANQNASIMPYGTWPNGFSINASGQLVVASGSSIPTTDMYYILCNGAFECKKIAVTFNGFNPGTITAPTNVCFAAPVTINNIAKASSSGGYSLCIWLQMAN